MLVRNWARNLISLAACGATAAALAYGGLTLNRNGLLRDTRASAAAARTAPAADGMQSYIVRFTDAPLAAYRGGVQGLSATNPQVQGRRTLDVGSDRSAAYLQYLASKHADFLDRAGQTLGRGLAPRFTYSYAFNGMALRLTRAEAAAVENLPGVQYVQPDRAYKPATGVPIPGTAAYTEPSRAWIGADMVWAKPTFNTGTGSDNEGEGIVVADLDTGVNALNSSFAATGLDHYTIPDPLGNGAYLGVCNSANAAPSQPNTYDANFAPDCNNKLIGAYTYTRYGASPSNDPSSPEDSEGHGSHTASTAAGDFTNASSVSGIRSPLSGVAPHANLIVYDVCDPKDSCTNSASVAAVDQAIQDQSAIARAAGAAFKGMVLNFSIGGSADPYTDPVDQAFFSAEQAGIYVSAAGGNTGPQLNNTEGYGPVQHLAPWLATNAASTDDSVFGANTLTVSGSGAPAGSPFNGLGNTGGYGPNEIVYAKNYPYTATYYASISTSSKYPVSGQNYADPTKQTAQQAAAECLYPFTSGNTSPTIPAGAIVVCDRGSVALVDKADNVKQSSAGGVVIVSQSGNALIAESYDIPGTMVDNSDGASIETWLNTSIGNTGFTATLSGSGLSTCGSSCSGIADQLAAFSARGPNNNVYDNILKPDLTAPGVQILAAVADPCYLPGVATQTCSHQSETFDFFDGTSMATPHDTGAAALLRELHGWTPMEIKSALMSTAVTGLGDQCAATGACTSTLPATPGPQAAGAGRLDVANAARAGFVLDEAFSGQATLVSTSTDAGASTLQGFNLASLANNRCITGCSWTRTLKATQTATLRYTVTTNQSWLTVSANGGTAGSSATFSLAAGGTATLVFTASLSDSNTGQWLSAEVDFSSGNNESDGSPPPAQHFPVAVFDQQPEPQMSVTPATLAATLSGGAPTTQTLSINNTGQATLNWSLSTVATTSSTSSSAMGGVSHPRTEGSTAAGPVVTQLPDGTSGNTSGYPSSVFTADGHGLYAADTFQMPVSGTLTAITTPGFTLKGTAAGSLADATLVSWYVYADSNGTPAGNPESGHNGALWNFSAAPKAAGVNTSDGNDISLDLTAAGAPPLALKAGSYWLVVTPTFPGSCAFSGGNSASGGCGGEAWYWDESAPGSGKASFLDPGNLTSSGGSSWNLIGPNTTNDKSATGSVSLAFTLTGTLNCSGSSIPGVSLSPTSGSVAAGGSGTVTVTFNPSGLQSGMTYKGAACIQGNDPNTPFIAVPVTETVSGSSGGGGGGGGALGLIGLLALAGFTTLRRRRA